MTQKLSPAMHDGLRLLAHSDDWTRLGKVTGIRRGAFIVNAITGRALSRRGYVEKRDARVRINERGRKIIEASHER